MKIGWDGVVLGGGGDGWYCLFIPQNCMSRYLVACIGHGEPRYYDICKYVRSACFNELSI